MDRSAGMRQRTVVSALASCVVVALLVVVSTLQSRPSVSLLGQNQVLASKDWNQAKWSPRHKRAVEVGKVDKASAKGIWHSDTEAWKGIDEVFPTDTPYAFELDHRDHGETAKMKTFIDHVKISLQAIEKKLPKSSNDKKGKAELASLKKVLEAGKSALSKIEMQVRMDGARTKAPINQLRSIDHASHHVKVGLRAHYISDKLARNDISSYFDDMEKQTQKENEANARASGNDEVEEHKHALHQLSLTPSTAPHVFNNDLQAKTFASQFVSQLASALAAKHVKVVAGESCTLCTNLFTCEDCCAPVCKQTVTSVTQAKQQVDSVQSKLAKLEKAVSNLEQKRRVVSAPVAPAKKAVVDQQEMEAAEFAKIEKELSQIASAASLSAASATAKGSSEPKQPSTTLSPRAPCECSTQECRECPDDSVRAYHQHLVKEKKALKEAEKAVAKSNAILRERIAALQATNSIAVRQNLNAYGPESSEDVWPAREPTPGKSEQIASGASGLIKDLIHEVGLAEAKVAKLNMQLRKAELAAEHEAEVTAEQRHLITTLSDQLHAHTKHASSLEAAISAHKAKLSTEEKEVETEASESMLPFYKQPEYGGEKTFEAVRYFQRHPNGVKAEVSGHDILFQD